MKRLMLVWVMILCLVPLGARAEEENAPALYPIRENGLWGYMNRAGEVVIEPQWKTARPFSGEYAIVSFEILPVSMWSMYGHHDGLIDRTGAYVIKPKPNQDIEEYAQAYRIRDYDQDCEGFLDKHTGFLQMPILEYKFVMLWGDDGSGPIAIENQDGLTGYVDRANGDVVIPFIYTGDSDDVCFTNGYAMPADEICFVDQHGESCGAYREIHLIDPKGNEVELPDEMKPYSLVSPDGYLVFGKALGTLIYQGNPEESDDENEDEWNWWTGPIYQVNPVTGEQTAYDKETDPYHLLSDGFDLYGLGVAKLDGTVIIEADDDYQYIELPGPDGMICYEKHVEGQTNSLCGHYDLNGNLIVPPTYDLQREYPTSYWFHNGYVAFKDEAAGLRYVVIDPQGHEIFQRAGKAEDGLCFELEGYVLDNGLLWYGIWEHHPDQWGIDTQRSKRYGLIRVADGQAVYITEAIFEDHHGGILSHEIYENQIDFSEGLHPVKQNGLWGYINEQAQWVIPPQYDKDASFSDGLALVEKDGKLMYIDHSGAVVWEER